MEFKEDFNWEAWEKIKIFFKIIFFLLVFVTIGALIYKAYLLFKILILQIKNLSIDSILWKILFTVFLCLLISILYNIFQWIRGIVGRIEARRDRIAVDKETVEKFLRKELRNLDSGKIHEEIEKVSQKNLHSKIFKKYRKELKKKFAQAENLLDELAHKERIKELKEEELRLEYIIQEKEKEAQTERDREEVKKKELLRELDTGTNRVFIKDDLSEEEIEVLLEDGYEQVNEYDINEKKFLTVFVKSPLNHSPTHTFLVWSLSVMLKNFEGVSRILEHDTKDADLTFFFKKKMYALEVETGTLLQKKHQARKKVSYLNYKYPGRWMFVVSNKNLFSAYRKLGPTTQRNEVEKKVRKLLGN